MRTNLFTCGAHAPESDHGAARRVRRAGRTVTIDIHCHYVSQKAEEIARPHFSIDKEPTLAFATDLTREINARQRASIEGKMTDILGRLAEMDAAGIDIQALSPGPTQYYYWLSPDLGRKTCRVINDELAGLVAKWPERFVAMGTVPLQDVRLAIEELERCVGELGFRGIEISSNVNGEELASGRLEPFFARAEALETLLFLHPLGFSEGRRLARHYFNNVIGNPLESTVAVGHLIFEGVLDRHPGLKICVAHGGGFLPTYMGRMDHAHGARDDCRLHIRHKPSDYLKRLYVDTVMFDPDQLAYVVKKFGAGQVLLGTDYPFDMAEADPLGFVARTPGLTEAERDAIVGGNAAALLGIAVDA